MNFVDLNARARNIVKLASTQTKVRYLKEWFIRDERGMWQKEAAKLLDATVIKATSLGMTDEQVDAEISVVLLGDGLMALAEHLKRKQ